MKNLYKNYAELKLQIALLEKQKDDMQLQIIEELESDGVIQKTTSYGSFKISGRRSYKYSSEIEELGKTYLQAKKDEEASGRAELIKHSQFITFTPNKK